MFRSLVTVPFALVLGFALARPDAHAAERVACPAQCDSCDDGTCHIECAPGSSCTQATVTCPSGLDCDVACIGEAACRSATIVAPSGHDLELSCKGDDACQSAKLQCGSGWCGWACATTGSCEGIAVE